jgi:DNA-binding beta-propeller fold protein YncE
MAMIRKIYAGLGLLALIVALGVAQAVLGKAAAAQAQKQRAGVPRFEVDPFWPKIPDKWLLGQVPGVAVDANDHVWIIQRPKSADQQWAAANPPEAECCAPAPPVMEFDAAGNYVQGWGGEGPGYEWPFDEHAIHIDYKGNVWLGSAGGSNSKLEHHLLKFTRSGKFLLQIGRRGQSQGSNDIKNLNQAADFYVYPKTNELFVADGYVNRRVIVFDADTGAYKRHWGAYGNKPDDAAPRALGGEGPAGQQFNLVHGVRVSTDGLVYVADRRNNRVQVFTPDGKFVNEQFIARKTLALGTAFAIGFSPDPQQQFLYVPDAGNAHVWLLNRQTLEILGSFGRYGSYTGQFQWVHSIAVDSKGNIYTGEVGQGRRAQKFVFKGLSSASSQ